jgi:rhodanese-related sulfurtransferase
MDQILKNFTLDYFGKGEHKISPKEFFAIKNGFLLDVRSKEEAEAVSIKMEIFSNLESKNIPINEIPDRIDEISKEKLIAVFCPANIRASIVYAYLLSKGFSTVKILEGGYSALTDAIKPVEILKKLKS